MFKNYSNYYDIVYRDKNYQKETDFLMEVFRKFGHKGKTLLSLGCGTCSYELLLAKKGFNIVGIDKSSEMLKIASAKLREIRFENKVSLFNKDIRSFKFDKKFDNAMAMFNIVGYQTTNTDFEKMLVNIKQSLKKDGIFIFDCWYLPAVLKDKPLDRIKKINTKEGEVIRITKSRLMQNENLIEINFDVLDIKKEKVTETIETHCMRYWSLPEIEYFLKKNGFSLVHVSNFMNLNSEISDNKWDIFVVARKN